MEEGTKPCYALGKSPNAEQSPYSEQAISAKRNEKLAICLHLKKDLLFLFACAKKHRGS